MADGLGLEARQREELLIASLLHDVGKIGVSERILLKPGPLTPDERTAIELHSRIGYHLVRQVPALHGIADAVLHHHERWDGAGYPDRLAGDEIPLDARVIAVADAFSAMTSDRPYRAAMPVEEACAELERCAGDQFDPRVVSLFVEQVRLHPPGHREGAELEGALADPEVQAQLEPGEPVLGYGPSGAVDNLTLLYAHRHLHEQAARLAEESAVAGAPYSVLLVELSDAVPDQRAARATPPATGPSSTPRAWCPTWPPRCTGPRAGTAGAGWPFWPPPSPARPRPRWVATWRRRLEETGMAVRTAGAEWRPGDAPTAAVDRARTALASGPLTAPPTPG